MGRAVGLNEGCGVGLVGAKVGFVVGSQVVDVGSSVGGEGEGTPVFVGVHVGCLVGVLIKGATVGNELVASGMRAVAPGT